MISKNERRKLYALEIVVRVGLAFAAFSLPFNIFTNDVNTYWTHARHISLHYLPYRDFTWEYPPLTLLPLVFLPLTGRTNLGFHLVFVATMIGLEYASLCALRRARPAQFRSITAYWSAVVVPMSALAWYRFDYMSIFAATLALIALEKNRSLLKPVLLGFLAKLWPIFFLVALFAQRKFKQTALILIAALAATGIWWALTPSGFHAFLRFRQGEGFQVESLPGSVLLLLHRHVFFSYGALNVNDKGLHWMQPIMTAVSLLGPALIAVISLRSKRRNDVALVAGVVALVLCTDRLLSPQFVTWLAPFVACLWLTNRRIGYIYGVVVALTLIEVVWYHEVIRHYIPADLELLARNLALVWLTVELLRVAFRQNHQDSPTLR